MRRTAMLIEQSSVVVGVALCLYLPDSNPTEADRLETLRHLQPNSSNITLLCNAGARKSPQQSIGAQTPETVTQQRLGGQ